MADVTSTLASWSSVTNNNSPAGTATVGNGVDDNMRELQGVVVRGLSHKGADIASTSTVDLGAVEGLMHDITGTTTISSFGTVRSGILKIVKFEGQLTLTHSASLVLPGSGNITTADGDVGWFFSEGSGVWRCVSYQYATNGQVPVGSVMAFAGATAPNGWLFAYGQAVSRTTYARLFSVISTVHGAGDGSTTFNLPDLRGHVIAGKDDMGGVNAARLTSVVSSLTLGAGGGSQTHTLTESEMPEHTHTGSVTDHSTDNGGAAGTGRQTPLRAGSNASGAGANNTDVGNFTLTINSTGGGGAHANVQPTLILNYCIKF